MTKGMSKYFFADFKQAVSELSDVAYTSIMDMSTYAVSKFKQEPPP